MRHHPAPEKRLSAIWQPLRYPWSPGLVAAIGKADVPLLLRHLGESIGYDAVTGRMWYLDAPDLGPESARGWPVIWLGTRALRAHDVAWLLHKGVRAADFVSPLKGYRPGEMRFDRLACIGPRLRPTRAEFEATSAMDDSHWGRRLPDLF